MNDKNLIIAVGCDQFLKNIKIGYEELIKNDSKGLFKEETLMLISEHDKEQIKNISEKGIFVSYLVLEHKNQEPEFKEFFKNQKCGKPDLIY